MTRALVVSEQAERDLREIWGWSYERFGEDQADRYLDQLDHGLHDIGVGPEAGRDCATLRARYWSRRIRKHIAFYTFIEDAVLIQRVLHGSMDPDLHLSPE